MNDKLKGYFDCYDTAHEYAIGQAGPGSQALIFRVFDVLDEDGEVTSYV